MPPASSQKGTGKKGGAGASRQQPRSRNTTPSSNAIPSTANLPPIEIQETETLDLKFDVFRDLTYEDLVDSGASSALIPDSKALDGIKARLERLSEAIERRNNYCDRGMRLLATNKRERRIEEQAEEERREDVRIQREADEERERKANKKKRKATESLAPQSGNTERSSPLREASSKVKIKKADRDNDSASSSLSPVAPRTPSNMDVDGKNKAEVNDDKSSSEDDGRPPPKARPQANTFGEDPSTFPDPTVYEILEVKPGMTEEEIREIYSVATYPPSDLADLIPGDPPARDFSSAKPSNQINFTTFSSFIEPYFRSITEEDLAFLRERGDRVTPFVMPKKGKKLYSEIWAEEDGAMAIDSPPGGQKLPPNQPRGSVENLDDEVAETDQVSVGPLLSRLLTAMRPEHRTPVEAASGMNGDGDIAMNGVASFDFSFETSVPSQPGQTTADGTGANGAAGLTNGTGLPVEPTLPPAAQMPECNSEGWRKASHPKLDYSQVDERIKQELRHLGFLPSLGGGGISSSINNSNAGNNGSSSANGTNNAGNIDPSSVADYDGHYDDEVAGRLRLLQARLREQALVNGARKARLTDLVRTRLAHQEYEGILEDLDSQVQAAYLKRTRTMGKKPKKARPGAASAQPVVGGAAAGGAVARPGIGDLTKTLMERRRRWIENIGTVFDGENLGKVPRVEDGDTSIFKPGEMAEFMKKERENWEEEVEDE